MILWFKKLELFRKDRELNVQNSCYEVSNTKTEVALAFLDLFKKSLLSLKVKGEVTDRL